MFIFPDTFTAQHPRNYHGVPRDSSLYKSGLLSLNDVGHSPHPLAAMSLTHAVKIENKVKCNENMLTRKCKILLSQKSPLVLKRKYHSKLTSNSS
ncbi:hypothetical protein RRG08_038100 [Elysia crispata]|uniref:Uncharacterized protein n=1 Tax=Elysia crispata TaxID=231223 RepID=A0AAE1DQB6_9GAST|nr:hypothetical protein RRG08_038100 [Elysia crispata]